MMFFRLSSRCSPNNNGTKLSSTSLSKIPKNLRSCNSQRRGKSTSLSDLDLMGVYPPIITPFNRDESIAWHKLQSNIKNLNATPIRGYLVQGSNGEYCYLTMDERIELIKKVKEYSSDEKILIAGSGCEGTEQTIDLTESMAEAGADAALIITPCYFKNRMNKAALRQHFLTVADSSSIPIILYNVPANTNIDLSPQLVGELAEHPNIIGIKESGGDITKIGRMVYLTQNQNFQVLAGSTSFLLASLHYGAVGGIMALANALPNECCQLEALFRSASFVEAKELQHRLILPNTAVTKTYGVAGLKQAMEWFGYYGGPTRKPLLPLNQNELKELECAFTSTGFLSKTP